MAEVLSDALERGYAAQESGRHAEAIAAFREALALAPREVGVALALANAQRLAGQHLESRATLIAAQRMAPVNDPSLGMTLGASLLDAGAPREAGACFARVMRLTTGDPAPIAALAGARRMAGAPREALPHIEHALRLAPEHPTFLLTAAQIHHDLGDVAAANAFLARAERARPAHGPTRLQRAYTTLLVGASAAGWSDFEARALPHPPTAAKEWHGHEPLEGATILATAEQGIGDQLQFVRFVHRLAARGASRVFVECQHDVVSLLRASGFDAVPRGEAPATDWHVPLLSLPHRLKLDGTVDGERVPYLRAPLDVPPPLAPRASTSARRFGIVWAGNPAFSGRITRDLDVTQLPSIVSIKGIEWIALQHGAAGDVAIDGLARPPLPSDWLASAAMLRDLDGLVTTDTGIAHLAGAMGVPTWVLLQYVPDWRWGLSGDVTPWYPSLRLVRQRAPGDWASVVATLSSLLQQGE